MSDLKQYTFYFYRPEPVAEGELLTSFLDGSMSQQPTDAQISGDYYIQIEGLEAVNSPRNSMIRGVVKKFRRQDIPSIGKLNEIKERSIELQREEAIVEKTHFLYNSSMNVLLYQSNFYGTNVKYFGEYLSHLIGRTVSFNPVIVPDAYKKILDSNLKLKRFIVKIARPTNISMLKNPSNSIVWDESMKLLDESTASNLTLTIAGDKREGVYISETFKEKIIRMMPLFGQKDGGKVTLIDKEGAEQVIDLIADRLSVKFDVEMDGKYPVSDTLFKSMAQRMLEKSAELKRIFG
ncbi:MAG: hypothetical protein OXF42_05080 [Candidatus Dadabacteria bacterium]|nr:hypothetical protein [Candidatus Dadabacteria bacterium]